MTILTACFAPRPTGAAPEMSREEVLLDYKRHIVPATRNLIGIGEPSNIVRIVPVTDEARRVSQLYDEMVRAQQHRQIL